MSRDEPNARRVALTKAIEERVAELRITYRELADRTGYSQSWIRYVRTDYDKEISPEFASQLDKALEWAEGSTLAVLADGEPTPLSSGPAPAAPARSVAARRAVARTRPPEDTLSWGGSGLGGHRAAGQHSGDAGAVAAAPQSPAVRAAHCGSGACS